MNQKHLPPISVQSVGRYIESRPESTNDVNTTWTSDCSCSVLNTTSVEHRVRVVHICRPYSACTRTGSVECTYTNRPHIGSSTYVGLEQFIGTTILEYQILYRLMLTNSRILLHVYSSHWCRTAWKMAAWSLGTDVSHVNLIDTNSLLLLRQGVIVYKQRALA